MDHTRREEHAIEAAGARFRGLAAAAYLLAVANAAPNRPLVGWRRGAARPTQIPAASRSHGMGTASSGQHSMHVCPLLTQAVCTAHGADAHLHSVIEGIAAVLSTYSGSVWSTHLLRRCRLYSVIERVDFEGPQNTTERMPNLVAVSYEHRSDTSLTPSGGSSGACLP